MVDGLLHGGQLAVQVIDLVIELLGVHKHLLPEWRLRSTCLVAESESVPDLGVGFVLGKDVVQLALNSCQLIQHSVLLHSNVTQLLDVVLVLVHHLGRLVLDLLDGLDLPQKLELVGLQLLGTLLELLLVADKLVVPLGADHVKGLLAELFLPLLCLFLLFFTGFAVWTRLHDACGLFLQRLG